MRKELTGIKIQDPLYLLILDSSIDKGYTYKRVNLDNLPRLNSKTSILRVVPTLKGNNLLYLSAKTYVDHGLLEKHEYYAGKLESKLGVGRIVAAGAVRDLRLGTIFG